MPQQQNLSLTDLLGAESKLLHQTLRLGFEKRIVQVKASRHVLYRYFFPWQAKHLTELLKAADVRQIPMQKLQHCTDNWQDALTYRGYWIVTSYIEGHSWPESEIRGEHAIALAKALADLHSTESRRSGLATSLLKKSQQRLKAQILSDCLHAIKSANHLGRQTQEEITNWLRTEEGFLDKLPRFQLLHGDLTGKNVLITEEETVALIDYELFNYGFAGLEVARSLVGLLGSNRKDLRPFFLKTYLDNCLDEIKTAWEEFGAQLIIFQLLLLAYGRTVRLRNLMKRQQTLAAETCVRQFAAYITEAGLLIRAFQDGQRDPEKLLTSIGR